MAKRRAVGFLMTERGFEWTGLPLWLIEPGRPMQTVFVERFDGKFRDACRNSTGSDRRALPETNSDDKATTPTPSAQIRRSDTFPQRGS